jgi:hypothetical protein
MPPGQAADDRQKRPGPSTPAPTGWPRTSCASQLDPLSQDSKHDIDDLAKAASGPAISPILLIRGSGKHPLIVAHGYHRVCASYRIDENTSIPCRLS